MDWVPLVKEQGTWGPKHGSEVTCEPNLVSILSQEYPKSNFLLWLENLSQEHPRHKLPLETDAVGRTRGGQGGAEDIGRCWGAPQSSGCPHI